MNQPACEALEQLISEAEANELNHIILEGSWDLVTRVITTVTILIITYNPT